MRLQWLAMLCCLWLPLAAASAENAPWGHAKLLEKTYSKQKVVYDVSVNTVEQLGNVLDRASYLSILNEADPFDSKIVIVLHGDEIGFFAIRNYEKYRDLMARAQSLTVGGIVDIRMCRAAAKRRGFDAQAIHGFITMVPMADAEIADLQKQGFAYMQ